MKKLLVTLGVVSALSITTYGQGTIAFANSAATIVQQQTSPTDSTLISSGAGAAWVQLLWAPIGTTDLGAFLPVVGTGVETGNNSSAIGVTSIRPTPGRFNGGSVTVNGVAPGSGVALVVRGWTGAAGSYEAALLDVTAQVGYSSIFTLAATGNPTSTPPGTPVGILTGGFSGLTLAYVPEPTSMALAGLGAAALLIFRRRK